MADYVTKIRTSTGDKQIDYNALANKPNVATLGSDGKVLTEQLPEMDYVPTSEKGAASGIATLDSDGKVPSAQLPSMDYIPTSQKGAISGVAPLNASQKIDDTYLPALSSSVSSTSTTTPANSYAVKQAYDKAVAAGNTFNRYSSGSNTSLRSCGSGNVVICNYTFSGKEAQAGLIDVDIILHEPSLMSGDIAATVYSTSPYARAVVTLNTSSTEARIIVDKEESTNQYEKVIVTFVYIAES